MKLDLYRMIQEGFAIKQKARVSSTSDWRGGNSGHMGEDGVIVGTSPRTTVLRHLGIESPTTLDDDLIFEAGFKNEDHWSELLELANVSFRCEEEIPVAWALPNGQTITGRPDTVIGTETDSEFTPLFGIEHKLISSNGKMVRHAHFAGANPSPSHVCQAAHYSSVFGIPWVLAYTNRAHLAPFYLSAKEFTFAHRSVRFTEKGDKIVNVSPFISMYDMTWQGDKLFIDDKETIITASGIERYYQYCSDCVRDKIIPEHGGDFDTFGGREKRNTNVVYDDFGAASIDGGFDQWVDECREIANADT